MNGYERFHFQREQVLKWLEEARSWLETLNLTTDSEYISQLAAKLRNESFRVMVVGEFKRGKSTFINAIIGRKVLPAYSTPCTAIINEIKYGDKEKARIYWRNPLPQNISEDALPSEVRMHLRSHQGNEVPPMEIKDPQQLEMYVVIPEDENDNQEKAVATSIYSHAELEWPLPFCQKGVEIIDSPGLNEHATRTKITREYLRNADAIVFIMSCTQFFSQSEKDYIENDLKAFGKDNVFFICNRLDQVEEEDQDKVKRYAVGKLGPYTNRQPIAYFLSAAKALKGRQNSQPDLFIESGFEEFEKALETYLGFERGVAKLRQPLLALDTIIDKLLKSDLQMIRKNMMVQEEELKKTHDAIRGNLDNIRKRSEQTLRRLKVARDELCSQVNREAENFTEQMLKALPIWMKEWEDTQAWKKEFSLLSTKHKQMLEAIMMEVHGKIIERIQVEQRKWHNETLVPSIQTKIEQIAEIIQMDVSVFGRDIQNVRATMLSGRIQLETDQGPDTTERIFAAIGGWIVGGVGGGIIGGTLGMKEMLKGLAPQAALAFGMVLLGLTNPFVLIPTLLGAGSLQALLQKSMVASNARQRAMEAFAKEMRNQRQKQEQELCDALSSPLQSIECNLEKQFRVEIQSIVDEMQQAVEVCRKSEDDKRKLEQQMALIEIRAQEIQKEKKSFKQQLAIKND